MVRMMTNSMGAMLGVKGSKKVTGTKVLSVAASIAISPMPCIGDRP